MKVYIKNWVGQQTVRELPFHKAIWLRLVVWYKYPKKEERAIIRFMI
jgi:hypothetical protein